MLGFRIDPKILDPAHPYIIIYTVYSILLTVLSVLFICK